MINTSELNQERASLKLKDDMIENMNLLEGIIDKSILESEMELLSGQTIKVKVHDIDNKFGLLQGILKRYEENGWEVVISREWSALFQNIKLTVKK